MTATKVMLAVACGCEAACAAYAVIRAVQYVWLPEPNPALVMQSVHAGYFWRAWISAYAGGFVALVVALLAGPEEKIGLAALRALPWSAALLTLQALAMP